MALTGRQALQCTSILFLLPFMFCIIGQLKTLISNYIGIQAKDPGFVHLVCLLLTVLALSFRSCLIMPQLLGVMIYDCSPKTVALKASLNDMPTISFRMVTRGDYPDLIKNNVGISMNACSDVGLIKYVVEIVTEKYMPQLEDLHHLVKQIVVPSTYKTKNGTLFKARNLQYCLEDGVSELNGEDWIVHLDEDSYLTTDAVIGIANFIWEGKHSFGQGGILYDIDDRTSYLTKTLMGYKYINDFGSMAFYARVLHSSICMSNGSFVLCKVSVEKDVSFDYGPYSSITEFVHFGLVAFDKGYSYGRVEGTIVEIGAVSCFEFITQMTRVASGMTLLRKVKSFSGLTLLGYYFVIISIVVCNTLYLPYMCYVLFVNASIGSLDIILTLIVAISATNDVHTALIQLFLHPKPLLSATNILVILHSFTAPVVLPVVLFFAFTKALLQSTIKFKVTKKLL